MFIVIEMYKFGGNPNFHIPRSSEKSCGFEDLGGKHIGSSQILHSLSTVYSLHIEDYPKLCIPSTPKNNLMLRHTKCDLCALANFDFYVI